MILKQDQKVAEGATAIQGNGDVTVNYGISPDEVRAMTLEVFRAEFYQFMGLAGDIATARAQKVVDHLLETLERVFPEGLEQARFPDFRYSILSAQRVHARAGDDDIEAMLIQLLVERAKEPQRTVRQIVLSESIEVMAKITAEQVAALSLVFLMTKTQNFGVRTIAEYLEYLDRYIKPLFDNLPTGNSTFIHLQYAGCGSFGNGSSTIPNIVGEAYPGIFQSGFTMTPELIQQAGQGLMFLVPHKYTENSYQVLAKDLKSLKKYCDEYELSESEGLSLNGLFVRDRFEWQQLNSILIRERPYFARLCEYWDTSGANKFILTSVGVAIAHANLKQQHDTYAALDVWVN